MGQLHFNLYRGPAKAPPPHCALLSSAAGTQCAALVNMKRRRMSGMGSVTMARFCVCQGVQRMRWRVREGC
jgi:hypothetical protein